MSIINLKADGKLRSVIRETVFGVEDGMVSTLGAMTGIAVGSGDRYTVILAGIVIIAVESISMGIGSYVSNKSSKEAAEKVIDEEKEELRKFPKEEENTLYKLLLRDGWSKDLARKMIKFIRKRKGLMVKEHSYRELGIFPYHEEIPSINALFMFFSYIIGGFVPLFIYFILPVSIAIYWSVVFTLFGLFLLGSLTSIFTKLKFYKAGLRLVLMGGFAFLVGLVVGEAVSLFK